MELDVFLSTEKREKPKISEVLKLQMIVSTLSAQLWSVSKVYRV